MTATKVAPLSEQVTLASNTVHSLWKTTCRRYEVELQNRQVMNLYDRWPGLICFEFFGLGIFCMPDLNSQRNGLRERERDVPDASCLPAALQLFQFIHLLPLSWWEHVRTEALCWIASMLEAGDSSTKKDDMGLSLLISRSNSWQRLWTSHKKQDSKLFAFCQIPS